MVYFESSDLGVTPYLKNWFNNLPKDLPDHGVELLEELFEFSLDKGFVYFLFYIINLFQSYFIFFF